VTVPAGQTSATFAVSTLPSGSKGNVTVTISASWSGVTKTATLTIKRK
jgi:hypothetical protein